MRSEKMMGKCRVSIRTNTIAARVSQVEQLEISIKSLTKWRLHYG